MSGGRFREYDYALAIGAYREANHSWLAELDGLAVHSGAPYQRMGTRRVDEDAWFVLDEHVSRELALRRRLLGEQRDLVFACRPEAEAAAIEANELIANWLANHGHLTELTELTDGEHPLAEAGLAVQDDLVLMCRDASGWRFSAAMLCFPTYWQLGDKIGDHSPGIHSPVPHYADDLAHKVERFFDRLPVGRIVSRRNWGLSPHPLLFVPDRTLQPPDGHRSDDPHEAAQQMWMRSERQTLRRLPRTGAILFGIRVQLAPITALAAHPDVCTRLVDAMEGWTPEQAASRGSRFRVVEACIDWLRAAC